MKILFSIHFIKILSVSILVFIILDLLWLALISNRYYFKHLGYLSEMEGGKIKFNLPVGLFVQAIIAMGLAAFIYITLHIDNSLSGSITAGSFLGLVLYCTYDLTNLSFVKGYPLPITIVDIIWGTAQGLFAGVYVFYLNRFF